MTWPAEVAHVMRKDAREMRWSVAGYLCVVTLATLNALGAFGARHIFEGAMVLVVATGMLVFASFVQSDSPTRPDAFWAAHPHRPSAVLVAKVFLAVVVIVLPGIVGQYVALSALHASGSTVARALADATTIFSAWLVLTLLISATTPDMRTFLLLVILTPAALLLFAQMLLPNMAALSVGIVAGASVVGFVGALVFAGMLYYTRDTHRRTWLAAFVLLAIIAIAATGPRPVGQAARPIALEANRRAVIHFETAGFTPARRGPGTLTIRVVVDSAPADERIAFQPSLAFMEFADGEKMTLAVQNQELLLRRPAALASYTLAIASSPEGQTTVTSYGIQLPPENQAAAKPLVSVTLEGTITATAPSEVGSLPLVAGAVAAGPGVRAQVDELRQDPGLEVALGLRSIVDENTEVVMRQFSNPRFAVFLVDEAHHTAQPMFAHDWGTSSGAMVLPGGGVRTELIHYRMAPPAAARSVAIVSSSMAFPSPPAPPHRASDTTWLRDRRLVIVQWKERGTYRVGGRALMTQDSTCRSSRCP